MKKQYRIVERYLSSTDTYYDVEYSYPYFPFWMLIACRATKERALDKIAYEKEQKPIPKPKVIYRE